MNSKTIEIFFVLSILLLTGCVNQSPIENKSIATTSAESDFLTYDNSEYKIKINYPKDWLVDEKNSDVIVSFFSPKESEIDSFQENVNITMNDLSENPLELNDYTEAAFENLPNVFEEFKQLESTPITLSNNSGHKIVFSGKLQGKTFKTLMAYAIKENISYIITYTAIEEKYSKYLGQVQDMIDSFKITGSLRETTEPVQSEQFPPSQIDTENNMQTENSASPALEGTNALLVGNWRVYSEAIFYDVGGNDYLDTPVTRLLLIGSDGKWSFGDSSGIWRTEGITQADWDKWGVPSYGPAKKIVLEGWNNSSADGPIEESETTNRIDFFWVIYRAEPSTVENAGQIQMKFGHTSS